MTTATTTTRGQILRAAAASLRRTNGPDPSQAEDFDGFDVAACTLAGEWAGVERAASELEEMADRIVGMDVPLSAVSP